MDKKGAKKMGVCDDLISRNAAIDAIEIEKSLCERPITETRWFDFGLGKAQEVLSKLHPAQPERKKGKWVREKCRGLIYKCSACGNYLDFDGVNAGRGCANFCPNCGAEMDGGKAE